jgi:hypothetical protein
MGGIIISKVLGARMFYWFADTGLSHLYQDNWECWFNISTNGREIEFETIHGFSRVTDFYEYDGVTNDKTERQIALTRLLRSNVLRNLCDWLTSTNLESCILTEIVRSTWLTSIQNMRRIIRLRRNSDKLGSIYVHGVPRPVNVELIIARFGELTERGFQNEWR